MKNDIRWISRLSLVAASLAVLVAGTLAPAKAQDTTPGAAAPRITVQNGGVLVAWSAGSGGEVTGAAAAAAAAQSLPTVRYNGYDLPMQTVSLALPEDAPANVQINQLLASELPGGVAPGAPELPPALDWEPDPNLLPDGPGALPTAPAFVLREGTIRGQRVVVVAISPIYQEDGIVKVASAIEALIPGATPLASEALDALSAAASGQVNTVRAAETVSVPVNQAAYENSFKLTVSSPGIQEVALSDLGLGSASGLRLTHNGNEVALEEAGSVIRFYAPTVGDRWNKTSVYWLSTGGQARMGARSPAAGGSPGVAYERGRWTDNKLYDSVYAGLDGDRWFNRDMRVDQTVTPGSAPAVTIPTATKLPATAGRSTFTANVVAWLKPPTAKCLANDAGYILEATMLDANGQALAAPETKTWNPAPSCILQTDWQQTWTAAVQPKSVLLKFLSNGAYPTGIKLDSATWEQPVALDFGGSKSAEFWTRPGNLSFTMSNLPGKWQLYDVTDPLNPKIVGSGGAGGASFSQDSAGETRYLLANLDAPNKPTIQQHTPVNFGDVVSANAIYIGPAQFGDEIQPLLNLRRSQGYAPLYVDVQSIFDVYGFGYLSSTAIRNFLRDRTDWQNTAKRISVVLVGDGTYDPYDYEGKTNANWVPPYMADVDPFIKEAACDQCYAQLNGDDPRYGDNPRWQHSRDAVVCRRCLDGALPCAQRGGADHCGRQDYRLRDHRQRQRDLAWPAHLFGRQLYQADSTRRTRRRGTRQAISLCIPRKSSTSSQRVRRLVASTTIRRLPARSRSMVADRRSSRRTILIYISRSRVRPAIPAASQTRRRPMPPR